jgi:hypothetical protein
MQMIFNSPLLGAQPHITGKSRLRALRGFGVSPFWHSFPTFPGREAEQSAGASRELADKRCRQAGPLIKPQYGLGPGF